MVSCWLCPPSVGMSLGSSTAPKPDVFMSVLLSCLSGLGSFWGWAFQGHMGWRQGLLLGLFPFPYSSLSLPWVGVQFPIPHRLRWALVSHLPQH